MYSDLCHFTSSLSTLPFKFCFLIVSSNLLLEVHYYFGPLARRPRSTYDSLLSPSNSNPIILRTVTIISSETIIQVIRASPQGQPRRLDLIFPTQHWELSHVNTSTRVYNALFNNKPVRPTSADELSHVLRTFTSIFTLFSLYFGLKLSLKRTLLFRYSPLSSLGTH